MKYDIIPPDSLNFTHIFLPASKSISNRALIINALSKNNCKIDNLSSCDDTNVMIKAFESNLSKVDIGAAGTSMRFLTAFLAQKKGEHIITGSQRMKQRPIKILVDALCSLGAEIDYMEKEGFPPLKIKGCELNGGEVKLDGSVSSQYISALLMIAPKMIKGLKLKLLGNVISIPYINLTLKLMEAFGVNSLWNGDTIYIKPQEYNRNENFIVESDWSSASYWYSFILAKGKGSFFLEGLRNNSIQGDYNIVKLFAKLGVDTIFKSNGVVIKDTNNKQIRMDYNFVNMPDMAQTFVVACCQNNIQFKFSGLKSLKIKETDRIAALINELRKFGYKIFEPNEGELEWDGEFESLKSKPIVETYNDHRMAMAFAPLAFSFNMEINNPEVVSKSYPEFWNDMKLANFKIIEKK